jgi:hypothetical protein
MAKPNQTEVALVTHVHPKEDFAFAAGNADRTIHGSVHLPKSHSRLSFLSDGSMSH